MKIYAAVQEIDSTTMSYLQSVALLARNMNVGLTLVAGQRVEWPELASTSASALGGYVTDVSFDSTFKVNELKLKGMVNILRRRHPRTDYIFDVGLLGDLATEHVMANEVLFWTIKMRSDEDLMTKWIGALETEFARSMDSPVLVITDDFKGAFPDRLDVIVGASADQLRLRKLTMWFKMMNCPMHFYFETQKEDRRSQLEQIDHRMNLPFKTIKGKFTHLSSADFADEVHRLLNVDGSNWLALAGTDKTIFTRPFEDLYTNDLVLKSRKPIILL